MTAEVNAEYLKTRDRQGFCASRKTRLPDFADPENIVYQCDECKKLPWGAGVGQCEWQSYQYAGNGGSDACGPVLRFYNNNDIYGNITNPQYGVSIFSQKGGREFTVNPANNWYDVSPLRGTSAHQSVRNIFDKRNKGDCCLQTKEGHDSAKCAVCWYDQTDECRDYFVSRCGKMSGADIAQGSDQFCKAYIEKYNSDNARHDPSSNYKLLWNRLCKGANLNTPTCRQYCSQTENDCEDNMKEYCESLGDNWKDVPICGCFLKKSIYDNFFDALQKEYGQLIPREASCYFPACVSSEAMKQKNVQQVKDRCPDVSFCQIKNTISNDGKIDGKIQFNSENKCNFTNNNVNNNVNNGGGGSNPSPSGGGGKVDNNVEGKTSSETSQTSNGSKLSTGAKVGIGIVVVALVLLICVVLYYVLRKKSAQNSLATE